MVWTILIGAVCFFLFKFFSALSKDNDDLQGQTLDKKFFVIVNAINNVAYNGAGTVTLLDKREFNLYEEGQNQLIKFQYSTGHLTIIWKYKYFHKEVVHQRQFNDVRNLSIFEQQKIADVMIGEMALVVERHKLNVMTGI
ncbi:hypothetical protein [Flaviaesturariibacter terrae]